MCALRSLPVFCALIWILAWPALGQADTFDGLRAAYRHSAEAGDYAAAARTAKEAAAVAAREFNEKDKRLADTLFDLGRYETRLGEHRSGIETLSKALALRTALYGTGALEYTDTVQALAAAYLAAGRAQDAIALIDREIVAVVSTNPEGNAVLAPLLATSALAYLKKGDVEQAADIASAVGGMTGGFSQKAYRQTADSLSRVAAVLFNMGRFDLSRGLHDTAATLFQSSKPPPNTAVSFARRSEIYYADLAANRDPEEGYVQIPFRDSAIVFVWPEAQMEPIRAFWRDARVGTFNFIQGGSETFSFFVFLVQARPGVTIERKGRYAPERILEITEAYDPDKVQWQSEEFVQASFAEFSMKRFSADQDDCVAFGNSFAPTARVARSKEMLGLFCRRDGQALSDNTIRAVVSSLGIVGYADPAAN